MADTQDGGRDERAAYLALTDIPGIGAARLRTLRAAFQTARGVLAAPHGALAALPGFSLAAATAIRALRPESGHRILDSLDHLGARVLLPWDLEFPPLLEGIPEPPALLYVWGDATLLQRPAVAMVGSRDHTTYGADAARLLAELEQTPGIRRDTNYAAGLPALVRCALAAGDADLAARLAEGVESITPLHAHALLAASAQLAEARGAHADAADLYAEVAEEWRTFGDVPERAYALLGRGRCLHALGVAGAADRLREARALFASLGYSRALAEADPLLGDAGAASTSP